jgi:O-antigen/teichoic acid export membrane protein
VTRTAALFTFPIFFGAAVTAPEFTVLMFGEKYAQSGGIMAVLALGSIPATITLFTAAAVMAAGSAKAVLRSNMVAAGSNLLLSAVLTPFGTLGAAVGSSISQFVITPYNLWLMRHALMVPGSLVLRAILPPLLAGGTMAGLLWSIKIFLLQGLSPALTILVLMSVGGVVYPAVLLVRGRRYLVDMAAELRPLLPARIAGWLAPGTVERS